MKREAYVIKDNLGNFARRDSVKKWDEKTSIYVSHKYFTECCRAYIGLEQAEKALKHLKSDIEVLGLDISFEITQVDLNDIVRSFRELKDEDMVLVEITREN